MGGEGKEGGREDGEVGEDWGGRGRRVGMRKERRGEMENKGRRGGGRETGIEVEKKGEWEAVFTSLLYLPPLLAATVTQQPPQVSSILY